MLLPGQPQQVREEYYGLKQLALLLIQEPLPWLAEAIQEALEDLAGLEGQLAAMMEVQVQQGVPAKDQIQVAGLVDLPEEMWAEVETAPAVLLVVIKAAPGLVEQAVGVVGVAMLPQVLLELPVYQGPEVMAEAGMQAEQAAQVQEEQPEDKWPHLLLPPAGC